MSRSNRYPEKGWQRLKKWAASMGWYWCPDCEDWVNEKEFYIAHQLSGYCKRCKARRGRANYKLKSIKGEKMNNQSKEDYNQTIAEAQARAAQYQREGKLEEAYYELEVVEAMGKIAADRIIQDAKVEHQQATNRDRA